jgi:hypothetical protein
MFKKGTENRWSDEVHGVKEESGKTIILIDGTTQKGKRTDGSTQQNHSIYSTARKRML